MPTDEPDESVEPMESEQPMPTDEPAISEPAVSGTILLPEGSTLEGAEEWTLEVQDTSLADASATVIGMDSGTVTDETATEIPFNAPYDGTAIEENGVYTVSARVTDMNGDLLFINDTAILVITNDSPTDGVDVPVIDVQAQAAEAEAVLEEAEAEMEEADEDADA